MNTRTCLLFILFSIIFINIGSASILNITVSDDAYVDSVNPNTNYGTQQELQTYNTDPPYKIIYLQFNTSSIPNGSTINSVDLYTYFYSGVADSSCGEDWGNRIESWRLNSIFNESTVTYNTKPSTVAAQGGELICIGSDFEWKTLNVAYPYSLNSGNIFGIQLIMRTPFAQQYEGPLYFYSKEYGSLEPYISIDYTSNSPSINSYSNTNTNNNSLSINVTTTDSVTFNATADQTITTWVWKKNGTVQSGNYDNFTTTFINGTHNISVNATNANGTSSTITWNITSSPSLTFQSLSISPTSFPQSQSTQITAWITGVSDPTSVTATILFPDSSTSILPLPSIGSDLYSSSFTQTNTPGRHYVTTITADSSTQNYNLLYPFTVTPTNTENTGSSSSSSSSSTPIPTSSPTPIPTTNPLDNIIPNLPDSLTQNNPLENFFESLPTSIKQTISYTLTPSLYIFDILFLLLIVILLYIIYNRKLEPSKIIFSTLTFFIVLRILNINLTTILTGVT